MQIENAYDKEVYNGDVGYATGVESGGGELTVSLMVVRLPMALANLHRTCACVDLGAVSIDARCRSARFA